MKFDLNQGADIKTMSQRLLLDGYIILTGAMGDDAFSALRSELGPYFDQYPNARGLFYGDQTVRFGGVFGKSKQAQLLACHSAITGITETILSPYCDRVQINLTQAIGIHPGQPAQVPHRDDTLFPLADGVTHFMLNCMVAIDPFTVENGGTRIWPRSHHGAFNPDIDPTAAIQPQLEAGDILLYLGSTVHSGGENRSADTRRGLVISYSLGWLRQAENQYLAYPPAVAKTFPKALQNLIGYRAHRPNLGWHEGRDPSLLLTNEGAQEDYGATEDLFPPELEAMARAYLAGEDTDIQRT